MDENTGQYERTPEEIAWDEEFRNEPVSENRGSDLEGLLRLAVRLPAALAQVPMAMIPDETAQHARAAARESFLAVRSLLGALGDSIEEMLKEPDPTVKSATVQGPPGTWGTGRAAGTTSSPKVKRIEVGGEEGNEPSTEPGDMP